MLPNFVLIPVRQSFHLNLSKLTKCDLSKVILNINYIVMKIIIERTSVLIILCNHLIDKNSQFIELTIIHRSWNQPGMNLHDTLHLP